MPKRDNAVRFKVFTWVLLKIQVFWNVTPQQWSKWLGRFGSFGVHSFSKMKTLLSFKTLVTSCPGSQSNIPRQGFPNFFAGGPLLASKNNHRSAHPCSHKNGVPGCQVSKIKNVYLRNNFRQL